MCDSSGSSSKSLDKHFLQAVSEVSATHSLTTTECPISTTWYIMKSECITYIYIVT